jgi:plastocyanin
LISFNSPTSGNTIEAFTALANKTAPPSLSPPNGLPVGGVRKLHIDVGLDGKLAFSPQNSTEPPGTVVEFSFNPKNHSVVQSSFDKPCVPLEGSFSSGFIPTTVSPSGVLFDIVVTNTTPIWFYCAQTTGNHCQAGMVGSINA